MLKLTLNLFLITFVTLSTVKYEIRASFGSSAVVLKKWFYQEEHEKQAKPLVFTLSTHNCLLEKLSYSVLHLT